MAEWEKIRNSGSTNYILRGTDFHISFNPDTRAGVLGESLLGHTLQGDTPEETALCRARTYLILNGDFRQAYESLIPQGYDACKRFYEQQAAHAKSSWSRPT